MNWETSQLETFLRMQFEMQQQSYKTNYPESSYQIILVDDQPVGHMLVAEQVERMVLVDIALLPDFRGGGIGTAFIEKLQREAGRSGKTIVLHVVATSAARRLYERLGFRATGDNGFQLEMQWEQSKF